MRSTLELKKRKIHITAELSGTVVKASFSSSLFDNILLLWIRPGIYSHMPAFIN